MSDTDLAVVDDRVVSRRLKDGSEQAVRWKDLVEVRVVTTSGGPAADVSFVLRGGDGSSCVVSELAAPPALVDRLQSLPGFDSGALLQALVATLDADLLCWSAAEG